MHKKLPLLSVLVLVLLFFIPLTTVFAAKEKSNYKNFQEVALEMHKRFEKAIEYVDNDQLSEAYEQMNEAYFGFYEVEGFEKYVGYSISSKRVAEIEAMFRNIKFHMLGKRTSLSKDELKDQIKLLSVKCYRDALVLDGVKTKDSPDSVGEIVLHHAEVLEADSTEIKMTSFITSFTLMLREGLEAILVCIAIVTYLIKSGYRNLCKLVYIGMLAGIISSIGLAFLVDLVIHGIGQEMLEGWTMFLAVAVLFYVSHWMLHRSEEEAWENYIENQVQKSLSKKNQYILMGAAFLAVIREGAELILFYKAAVVGGKTDISYSFYGLLLASIVLLAVWFIFRYTTVKLPLRPFFFFTSILLFVLCISFMGKGVVELTEAGVISGSTVIPAMNGFTFDWLGIYDRAETVIPQLMLLIVSLWIIISSMLRQRKMKRPIKNIENK